MPTNKRRIFIPERQKRLAEAGLASDSKVGNINKISSKDIKEKVTKPQKNTVYAPEKQSFSGGIAGEAGRRAGAGGVQQTTPKVNTVKTGTDTLQSLTDSGFSKNEAASIMLKRGAVTQDEVNKFLGNSDVQQVSTSGQQQTDGTDVTYGAGSGGKTDEVGITGSFGSIEDRAEAELSGKFFETSEFAEKYGFPTDVSSSLQEFLGKTFADQQREIERRQQMNRLTEEIEQGEFGIAERGVKSAQEAAVSSFAQGREGVFSEGTSRVGQEFKKDSQEKLDLGRKRLMASKLQREQTLERLKEAQRRGNESLAESLAGQLANIENDIREEQDRAQKQKREDNAEAFSYIEKLATLSDKAGGGLFNGWEPQDISDAIGVDIASASIMKNIDEKIQMIDTSDVDYAQKVANLRKAQQEAAWFGLNNTQKAHIAAQQFEDPEIRNKLTSFAEENPNFQYIKHGDSVYAFDPKTSKVNEIISDPDSDFEISAEPTGEIVTATIANRNVQLDSSAMVGFLDANQSFKNATGSEIMIGDPKVSSTASQADRIKYAADQKGIPFNEANPNQTAQELRSMGFQIANTGQSNHSHGMAVDIYPDHNYINKVKPYLEAAGWRQPLPIKDAGHFEYVGKTVNKELKQNLDLAIKSLKFGSVASQDVAYETMDSLVKGGEIEQAKEYLLSQVRNSASSAQQDVLDGKENTLIALDRIEKNLEEYIAKGGDTGVFTGAKEKALGKFGRTADPELAEIVNDIGFAIIDYRRAVSGAAFTESEARAYEALFPSAGKVPELNQATINAIRTKMTGDTEQFYKQRIGANKYDSIFGSGNAEEPEQIDVPYSLPEDNELTNRY